MAEFWFIEFEQTEFESIATRFRTFKLKFEVQCDLHSEKKMRDVWNCSSEVYNAYQWRSELVKEAFQAIKRADKATGMLLHFAAGFLSNGSGGRRDLTKVSKVRRRTLMMTRGTVSTFKLLAHVWNMNCAFER